MLPFIRASFAMMIVSGFVAGCCRDSRNNTYDITQWGRRASAVANLVYERGQRGENMFDAIDHVLLEFQTTTLCGSTDTMPRETAEAAHWHTYRGVAWYQSSAGDLVVGVWPPEYLHADAVLRSRRVDPAAHLYAEALRAEVKAMLKPQ